MIAHLAKFTACAFLAAVLVVGRGASAAETIFANYFDIKTGSSAGAEVIGKINLLRNKDAHTVPVPATFAFSITSDPSGRFEIVNERDSASRLFGKLRVKPGQSIASATTDYALSVALFDGANVLASAPITVHAVNAPLQEGFLAYAKNHCVADNDLYGKAKYNDTVVGNMLTELEANGGRFNGYDLYTRTVASFVNTSPNLSNQWQQVGAKIGGLGYAYFKSAKYGPAGLPADRLRLKNGLYAALREFLNRFPVNPAGVVINGQPIGTDYGDGMYRLNEYGIISYNDLTHQWKFTDPLIGPAIWLHTDLVTDARNGDANAILLREKLPLFFQASFGNVLNYRSPNDPTARWGQLTDTNHTEGALSDANLGHRLGGWLAMPAIWEDYNRPITYVPYWYDGYYSAYPGFQYRPGWSPSGVLGDYLFWVTHVFNPAHEYRQSGFHPDGTITHHSATGSGIAMWAYGHAWLEEPIASYEMLKNSGIDIGSGGFNQIADHYLHTYDKIAFKGDFDFTTVGRSYYSDMHSIVSALPGDVDRLIAAKQPGTQITQEQALVNWRNALVGGVHEVTGNFPFWVSNYMVHRKGGKAASTDSHFFSVKMGNDVTETADEFENVGKDYHAGSGTMQVKVTGTEYDFDVRKRQDWHALPGLTEEWRTDVIPTYHGYQTTGSAYAGMASDGVQGFAAMRYRPGTNETYAVAQADKGYFFSGAKAVALGCNVARRAPGQGRTIITTIDQTRWTTNLTYSVNGGSPITIPQGGAVDSVVPLTGPTWVHQGQTGYLLFPQGSQPLYIRGGSSVVDSDLADTSTASIIHLALGHGMDPTAAGLTKYFYITTPNKTAAEMPALLAQMQANLEVVSNGNNVQGVYDRALDVLQLAFHAAATASLSDGLQVTVDRPALVQLRRTGGNWEVSATDPMHDLAATAVNITVNTSMTPGSYSTTLPGTIPRPGEGVTVTPVAGGVRITVPLPDATDDANLNYQAELYASVPIHVTLPGNVAPVAVNDSATTAEDTAKSIAVLANDTDANGDPLAIQSVTQGANGATAINGTSVIYTPKADWSGVDTFSYSVSDGQGGAATASVTVTVTAVNDAPTFVAGQLIMAGGTIGVPYNASIASAATDVDVGDTFTFSKIAGPAWLNVSASGALSGVPPGGSTGINTFTVRVTDNHGGSSTATLTITPGGGLPSGWAGSDVGSVGVAGGSSESGGVFTVSGGGGDIGGTVDSFHFTSSIMTGDGDLRARVTAQTNTDPAAKAGVMLRTDAAANAAYAMVAITPGSGFTLQYRSTAGGASISIAGPALNPTPNNWVRITRSGTVITGYVSANGNTWTPVGTATISLPPTALEGIAVTSHNNAAISTAALDNVRIAPFPAPWQTADVGSPGLLGSAEFDNAKFTIKGAGIVGGTADNFRFVYQTLSGDGEIVARVVEPQNTGVNARLGLMVRESLAPEAAGVFMGINGGNTFYWQRRTATGVAAAVTTSKTGAPPNVWVRIVRTGSTLYGYKSADGVTWTEVNSRSIAMTTNVLVGIVVASGSTTTLNTSGFDNVTVVP